MHPSRDIRRELARDLLDSAGEIRSMVRGGSMLPTIFPGDRLEIRRRHFEDARPGDVVLTLNRGDLCTHRVVREDFRSGQRVLITRGDSLPAEDQDPVGKEDFLGSVELVIRRNRRFRPEAGRNSLRSILRTMLQQSPSLRTNVLRVHSLLSHIAPRANSARFRANLSGDAA